MPPEVQHQIVLANESRHWNPYTPNMWLVNTLPAFLFNGVNFKKLALRTFVISDVNEEFKDTQDESQTS